MAVDWLMRTLTHGIRQVNLWTLMTVIENLNYCSDVLHLSSKHKDTKQNAERLRKTTKTIGVNDNTRENNVLRKNTRANDPVIIDGNLQQDDGKVNYLFHKVIKTGVCYEETNTRICKANQASAILKPVWRVTKLNVHAKMKIF